MKVLVITTCKQDAMAVGMSQATRHHHSTPEVRFWWPGTDLAQLQGLRFDLIVRDPGADVRVFQRDWLLAHCTYGTTLFVKGKATQVLAEVLLDA